MILRTTPEMRVYRAFAETVRMYFGNRVQVTAHQRGSHVLIRISDLPLYGKGSGPVVMELPAGQIVASRDSVRLRNPILGDSVSFKIGDREPFPHAHIWDTGTPCWSDMPVTNLQGLFCVLVNTVTWMNISRDSRAYGGFTKCACTSRLLRSRDMWGEVEAQRAAVSRKVGFDVRARNPADFYRQTFASNLSKAME